jgi:hypothetical protein
MHFAECVLLVGLPGDYRRERTIYLDVGRLTDESPVYWLSDSYMLRVYFKRDGRVSKAEMWPSFSELRRRKQKEKE